MTSGSTPAPLPRTAAGQAGLAALLARPDRAVVALDFDGTLAPIVPDPTAARAHPAALSALARLTPRLDSVVVVTGRPATLAVEYAGLAAFVGGVGRVTVLGQYGLERWDSTTGRLVTPLVAPAVAAARTALPAVLAAVGLADQVWVEDKGQAFAVHTRRAPDPVAAFDRLTGALDQLAAAHGLLLEPGRLVLELRPQGVDKGVALTDYLTERSAGAVLYAGDDLGDLPAFAAVERLRSTGVPGVTVCSGSAEVHAVADRADLVVDGPAGVVDLLRWLGERVG